MLKLDLIRADLLTRLLQDLHLLLVTVLQYSMVQTFRQTIPQVRALVDNLMLLRLTPPKARQWRPYAL